MKNELRCLPCYAGYDFNQHEVGQTERHGGGFSILVGNLGMVNSILGVYTQRGSDAQASCFLKSNPLAKRLECMVDAGGFEPPAS